MIFEKCPIHQNFQLNIIVQNQKSAELTCRLCFDNIKTDETIKGLVLNQNTQTYFFKWNEYFICQLNQISQIVVAQGFEFLFQKQSVKLLENNRFESCNDKRNISADSKQILNFAIQQHKNLLQRNLNFINQSRTNQGLLNPLFLKDLYNVVYKGIELIIHPILISFESTLRREFNFNGSFLWKKHVIDCIQSVRNQIINDWVLGCMIEKNFSSNLFKSFSVDQSIKDPNERLQTQHSFNKSSDSKNSLSFQEGDDEQIDLVQTSQFQESNLEVNTNDYQLADDCEQSSIEEQYDNKKLLVNELQQQNDFLRQIIRQKEQQLELANLRLIQSEQLTSQWIQKYKQLQQQHRITLSQKIPNIQSSMDTISEQMNLLIKQSDEQTSQIAELQQIKKSLRNQNDHLILENRRLDLQLSQIIKKNQDTNYYLNPYYQSNKYDQQLLEQIVELQSMNMEKNDDILVMVKCVEKTVKFIRELQQRYKKQLKYQQQLKRDQQNNKNISFIKQWQKSVNSQLICLKTVKVNNL